MSHGGKRDQAEERDMQDGANFQAQCQMQIFLTINGRRIHGSAWDADWGYQERYLDSRHMIPRTFWLSHQSHVTPDSFSLAIPIHSLLLNIAIKLNSIYFLKRFPNVSYRAEGRPNGKGRFTASMVKRRIDRQ